MVILLKVLYFENEKTSKYFLYKRNSNSLAKLIWLDKFEEIAVKTSSNRLSFLIFSLFQSAFFSLC